MLFIPQDDVPDEGLISSGKLVTQEWIVTAFDGQTCHLKKLRQMMQILKIWPKFYQDSEAVGAGGNLRKLLAAFLGGTTFLAECCFAQPSNQFTDILTICVFDENSGVPPRRGELVGECLERLSVPVKYTDTVRVEAPKIIFKVLDPKKAKLSRFLHAHKNRFAAVLAGDRAVSTVFITGANTETIEILFDSVEEEREIVNFLKK